MVDSCRGHKYQRAITRKIYSLRDSFPELTISLSRKMFAGQIENEKIEQGRLHKIFIHVLHFINSMVDLSEKGMG